MRMRLQMRFLLLAALQATAFEVFQLDRPTPDQPYIKGLLDPCTNSLTAPNIPAEVLYDKQVCPLLGVGVAELQSRSQCEAHCHCTSHDDCVTSSLACKQHPQRLARVMLHYAARLSMYC